MQYLQGALIALAFYSVLSCIISIIIFGDGTKKERIDLCDKFTSLMGVGIFGWIVMLAVFITEEVAEYKEYKKFKKEQKENNNKNN